MSLAASRMDDLSVRTEMELDENWHKETMDSLEKE